MNERPSSGHRSVIVALAIALAGCAAPPPPPMAGLERIEHIVVIFAENRSFDHLYGRFPGANGLANATADQKGYIDHTTYDTTSIIKFITVRFGLEPLPGVRPRAGDLTAAFDFAR